jgi:hypothetical protein
VIFAIGTATLALQTQTQTHHTFAHALRCGDLRYTASREGCSRNHAPVVRNPVGWLTCRHVERCWRLCFVQTPHAACVRSEHMLKVMLLLLLKSFPVSRAALSEPLD